MLLLPYVIGTTLRSGAWFQRGNGLRRRLPHEPQDVAAFLANLNMSRVASPLHLEEGCGSRCDKNVVLQEPIMAANRAADQPACGKQAAFALQMPDILVRKPLKVGIRAVAAQYRGQATFLRPLSFQRPLFSFPLLAFLLLSFGFGTGLTERRRDPLQETHRDTTLGTLHQLNLPLHIAGSSGPIT
jgi:hypothetical protein